MMRPLLATFTAALVVGMLAVLFAGTGGSAAGAGEQELWQPPPGARWQYQLESANRELAPSGGINVGICRAPHGGGGCVRPGVFDIDLYVDGRVSGNDHTINTAAVEAIHDRGGHAICYVSAGTAERFRPDYRRYLRFDRRHHHSLIGKPFSDVFPNEFWLNIRNGHGQREFILRRVEARTEKCARAGFDGVEYDNLDAYAQGRRVTGWRIKPHAQLVFNRTLARIAHRNGL
jgi:glycosyl hydrolase family 114